MSTLADKATAAAVELRNHMQQLRDEVRTAKAACADPAAVVALNNLQASLLIVATDCEQIRALLCAARTTGQLDFQHAPQRERDPYPDRQCAAAHDDTFTEDPQP